MYFRYFSLEGVAILKNMSELRVSTLLPAAVAFFALIRRMLDSQARNLPLLAWAKFYNGRHLPSHMFWSVVGSYVPWFQSVWLALSLIHILVYTEDLGNLLMFLFFSCNFIHMTNTYTTYSTNITLLILTLVYLYLHKSQYIRAKYKT